MPDADSVIAFYERNIENWKRERSRSLFEKAWLDRFLTRIPPGGEILDLGCGTGQPIAAYLLKSGFRVTGIDPSPSMIAACKTNFPEGEWPKGEWLVGDMRALNLNKTFDAILAWDSYFHLPPQDQISMFAVFQTHVKPGAPVMFTAGPESGEVMNPLWDAPLYHASLAPQDYVRLFEQHGFRDVVYKTSDPDCGGHSIYLAQAQR